VVFQINHIWWGLKTSGELRIFSRPVLVFRWNLVLFCIRGQYRPSHGLRAPFAFAARIWPSHGLWASSSFLRIRDLISLRLFRVLGGSCTCMATRRLQYFFRPLRGVPRPCHSYILVHALHKCGRDERTGPNIHTRSSLVFL
jgi:hypothetical protein